MSIMTPIPKSKVPLGAVCICCHEPIGREDAGWVKQKGVRARKYFHLRCVPPPRGRKEKVDE